MSRPRITVGVTRVWVRWPLNDACKADFQRTIPRDAREWDGTRFAQKLHINRARDALRVLFRHFDVVEVVNRDKSMRIIGRDGHEVKQEDLFAETMGGTS